jgi:cytochrome c oxidase cbb3-type subunit 3
MSARARLPVRARRRVSSGAAGLLTASLVAACGGGGDERPSAAAVVEPSSIVRTSDIVAAGGAREPARRGPFEDDKVAIEEGKRLYVSFNCAGCHGTKGGGGMGPPFADGDWIYGGEPQNVFQSIVQGRPNGMPSFGGKIPEPVLWRIVAYVRSLSPPAAGKGGSAPSEGGSGPEPSQ